MERKLATIERIINIEPIPGADAIEKATVRGWNIVIRKSEFEIGDMVVYFEIDSFLPVRPEFEFLRKSSFRTMADGSEGFRIRTIRLRNQVSQGIIFPLSIFPTFEGASITYEEGDDVSEYLGIKKYETPIPAELAGVVIGPFPSFISKTDESRIQNIPWVLSKYKGYVFYVSEKLDGASCSIFLNNDEFGVCSRNLNLKESETNSFWRVARQLGIEEKMRKIGLNITIQGELIGEGIQGNHYKLKGQTIRFFNVYNIDSGQYLNYDEFVSLITIQLGLETVPLVNGVFSLPETTDELLKFADGKSLINLNVNREGIVLRPVHAEIFDADMSHGGRLSFKAISNAYLLEHGA
jgi:RNA ligase (TIGR02306 family)